MDNDQSTVTYAKAKKEIEASIPGAVATVEPRDYGDSTMLVVRIKGHAQGAFIPPELGVGQRKIRRGQLTKAIKRLKAWADALPTTTPSVLSPELAVETTPVTTGSVF